MTGRIPARAARRALTVCAPAPESAYQNSTTAGNYCDTGIGGTGTFRLDSGPPPCWTGYQPLFQVATS
jgi:hypothetical protein